MRPRHLPFMVFLMSASSLLHLDIHLRKFVDCLFVPRDAVFLLILAPAPVYPLTLLAPVVVPPAVLPGVVPAVPVRPAAVPPALLAVAPAFLPAAPAAREATFDAPPDDPDTSETVYRDGSGLLLLTGICPKLVPCFDCIISE